MYVQLDRVMAPARVNVGEPHEVRVIVSSQQAASAHLLLFQDQTLMGEREVELRPGQPEHHLHGTVEDDHGGEISMGPHSLASRGIWLPRPR
jgi:hypothetical protein